MRALFEAVIYLWILIGMALQGEWLIVAFMIAWPVLALLGALVYSVLTEGKRKEG